MPGSAYELLYAFAEIFFYFQAAVENAAAGELLLELMVRIASHPDQWDKRLSENSCLLFVVENIDRDLMTSRNVVSSLKSNSPPSGRVQNRGDDDEYNVNKEVVPGVSGGSTPIGVDQRKETWNERGSDTKHFDATREKESKWPTFEDEAQDNEYVKFVNNTSAVSTNHTARNDVQKDSWQMQNRSAKSTYPKNFSYHRVTGKPIYLNKNPTAYIAVSVIAPKQINVRSKDEDVTLERQLHQLKPWTRSQNLENTADVRSRWAKRRDEFKTKPIPPTL
ncbi:hypothetical protein NQ318_018648 [Aromia moschata]|uniref:Uncharacterized protein n=1 Tax=Aromia moschata TaxID=1265417 RepID=A0AAV8ZHF4_9CUCU|nr:hypothetical protein NQ318_018648 [Aromia moschata]